MQTWRAVANFGNDEQSLIVLGTNPLQISNTYSSAFFELITTPMQKECKKIMLQKWRGDKDFGTWVDQGLLKIPF